MTDAIPASSVRLKTMADGTLHFTIAVEPAYAQDAFAMMGSPGVPLAIARLTVGTPLPETATEPEPPAEAEPAAPAKGGPLAKWAALRCQDDAFRGFFQEPNEGLMRDRILRLCGINSRAELDSNPQASGLFRRHFMEPWRRYCEEHGVTA